MATNPPNICGYKQCCAACTKVHIDERPSMCDAIGCEDYLPCPSCGKNRTLHDLNGKKLCKQCHSQSEAEARKLVGQKSAAIKNGQQEVSSGNGAHAGTDAAFNATGGKVRTVTMSPPGTPPSELTAIERNYYEQRWKEFKGYYRNPSAYFVCHTIIIEEINLNYLNEKQIMCRGEMQAEIGNARSASLRMLELLNKQLPAKESEDEAEDENFLSKVYQRYVEAKSKRSLKGISRVFSSEAVAMAPELTFPIDPADLMTRCGWTLQEALDIAKHITLDDNIAKTKTPKELLEYFGIRLDEQYAMKYGEITKDEDDEDQERIDDADSLA
jgi:hypothetical protein